MKGCRHAGDDYVARGVCPLKLHMHILCWVQLELKSEVQTHIIFIKLINYKP